MSYLLWPFDPQRDALENLPDRLRMNAMRLYRAAVDSASFKVGDRFEDADGSRYAVVGVAVFPGHSELVLERED